MMRSEVKNVSWGDEVDASYDEELTPFPQSYETPVGEDGFKTICDFTTNEKGQRIKIVKRIKVNKVKVNTKVLERKKWKKFGEGGGEGLVSVSPDEVPLELTKPVSKKGPRKTEKDYIQPELLCRTCGAMGSHYTHHCPLKEKEIIKGQLYEEDGGEVLMKKGERYVIPVHRGRGSEPERPDPRSRQSEIATIRVTNLSEDIKERDLAELFGPFGRISRIYLAVDRNTGHSKGFAFINFVHREEAAKAMKALEGKGVDHLILHLEWARPSTS